MGRGGDPVMVDELLILLGGAEQRLPGQVPNLMAGLAGWKERRSHLPGMVTMVGSN